MFSCALFALSGHTSRPLAAHEVAAHHHEAARVLAKIAPPPTVEASSRLGPTFPKQWEAAYTLKFLKNGKPMVQVVPINENSIMYSDSELRQSVTLSNVKFPGAPAELVGTGKDWMNFSSVMTEPYEGCIINGETLLQKDPGDFNDLFGWALGAKDGGMVEYNGTMLHAWSLEIAVAGFSSYLLVDATGAPVYLDQNVTVKPPSPYAGKLRLTYDFHSFTPHKTWPGWATLTKANFTSPPRCPNEGGEDPPAVTKDLYIFHPQNNFNITGQDMGDVTGDVFFTCIDILTGQNTSVDHDYEWITYWQIDLVPRWGQYQNCNGYPPQCFGAENYYVGHEAAQGLGLPMGGQCEVNNATGEWYSLPAGGKCAAGASPGAAGRCTWAPTRVKTIDSACLFQQRGFAAACKADGRAPFASAAEKFRLAFASEDPSKGGCPALSPGREEAVVEAA